MTLTFLVGRALTVPLFAIAMGSMIWPDMFAPMHGTRLPWTELALSTPVVLWGGLPFFQRFWTSLVNRSLEHVHADRIGYGSRLHLQRRRDHCAANLSRFVAATWADIADVYFEAAAAIIDARSPRTGDGAPRRSRTGAAIRALLDLAPKTARLRRLDGRRKTFRSSK